MLTQRATTQEAKDAEFTHQEESREDAEHGHETGADQQRQDEDGNHSRKEGNLQCTQPHGVMGQ